MNPFQPFIADLPALPECLNYKIALDNCNKIAHEPHLSTAITSHKVAQLATVAYAMHANSTVCLYQCRGTVAEQRDITMGSAYQYLVRFFKTGKTDELNWLCFAMVVRMLTEIPEAYFLIDRTEWKHGEKWYNLLVIGLVVNQVFIPLSCHDLGERKSSSTDERKALWQDFEAKMKWINGGKLPTIYVAADREFGTSEWIEFLIARSVSFVFRAKSNHKWDLLTSYTTISHKTVALGVLARWGRRNGINTFALLSKTSGQLVYLHIVHLERAPKGQQNFLCLLSDSPEMPKTADFYAKRWKIESCFKHLKTNGFNLEKLNLLPTTSVELLFMLLAVIYTLTIMEGIDHDHDTTVRIIKYRSGATAPAQSLFTFARQVMKKTIKSLDHFYQRCIFFWQQQNKLFFNISTPLHITKNC